MPNDLSGLVSVSSRSDAVALATNAALALPVVVFVRVLACVLMARAAMGAKESSRYVSFNGGKRSESANKILLLGNRFQVPGVHTAVDTAKMIKFKPFWDWSAKQFVCNAVRHVWPSAIVVIDPEVAVVGAIPCCGPQPAAGIRLWVDVLQKAVNKCKLGLGHVTPSKSHRSGLHGASNRFAALHYFSPGGVLCPTK